MHATGISNRWAHDLSGNTPAGINASMSRINKNVRSGHGRALRYARYWPLADAALSLPNLRFRG